MEQWHYDPAADFDRKEIERIESHLRKPGMLVFGMRTLAACVLRLWLRLYHRLAIVGRENLPKDRSFIMIANHASHLDTLCLLSALPLRKLHGAFPAAAKDYFCLSAPRALLAAIVVNALPFDRYFAPWQSLGVCAHLLEKPETVLIFFPEGTRSAEAEPGEFKTGVALLAAGRDIPVVPCHLAGTCAALPKGSRLPRPQAIRLTIGPPRVYAHVPATKDAARAISRELRTAVLLLRNNDPTNVVEEVGTNEIGDAPMFNDCEAV